MSPIQIVRHDCKGLLSECQLQIHPIGVRVRVETFCHKKRLEIETTRQHAPVLVIVENDSFHFNLQLQRTSGKLDVAELNLNIG